MLSGKETYLSYILQICTVVVKGDFKSPCGIDQINGEDIIAGVLIDYKVMNGIPRTVQLGVLSGDFHYVKKGALIAIYYYTIEYLRKKNHKKLSLGLARPFINDGLLNQKLSWGAKIVCETSNAFLLRRLSHRKCVDTFFSNNPFICKDRTGLTLETFTKGNSKEDKKFAKYRKKLNCVV